MSYTVFRGAIEHLKMKYTVDVDRKYKGYLESYFVNMNKQD